MTTALGREDRTGLDPSRPRSLRAAPSSGPACSIGPWCTVGANVVIEDGARPGLARGGGRPHDDRTGCGSVSVLHRRPGAAGPEIPGEPTRCEIGARTQVREHCTIHRGTVTGRGITRVGADCLLMAVAHVAHDCQVGDHVIVANNAVMGGHVSIADHVVIGGAAAIHQFVRIGRAAMIGGVSGRRGRRDPVRQRDRQPRAAGRAERDRPEAARLRQGADRTAAHGVSRAVPPRGRVRAAAGGDSAQSSARIRWSPRCWRSSTRRAIAG